MARHYRKLITSFVRYSLWIIAIIIVIGFIYLLFDNQYTPSTNDAHLYSRSIMIAPQVAGKIIDVPVHNHQQIKEGQLLFSIDPMPYQHDVTKAKSALEAAKLKYEQLFDNIKHARDQIKLAQDINDNAKTYFNQIKKLKEKGYVSATQFNDVYSKYLESKAALEAQKQSLKQAESELGNEKQKSNHLIDIAEAELENAKLKLKETQVYAPSSGYLTNITVSKGTYAKVGETMMTLVTNHRWWVIANFRENSLTHIKAGDLALVSFSFQPNNVLKGYVKSIGWGVNLNESVPDHYLPHIKSKRDWIRLAQRFPVNIEMAANQKVPPARSGASAYVTVITDPHYSFNFLAIWTHHIYSFFEYIF